MRVGATLVRDSNPKEEAHETEWKLKGLLRSIQNTDTIQLDVEVGWRRWQIHSQALP